MSEPAADRSGKSAGEIALWVVLALAIAGLMGFAVADRMQRGAEGELQVYKELPVFQLENRDGRPIGSAELAGKPFIADFMFTSCPGVCPILSKRMGELARELDLAKVNLVSFTVDPDTDHPPVLEAYAAKLQAPPQWYFLTGAKASLYALIREGFQLVVDDSNQQQASDPILHSNKFVLVDASGRIRGYYNAFEPTELELLRRDLGRLLR